MEKWPLGAVAVDTIITVQSYYFLLPIFVLFLTLDTQLFLFFIFKLGLPPKELLV